MTGSPTVIRYGKTPEGFKMVVTYFDAGMPKDVAVFRAAYQEYGVTGEYTGMNVSEVYSTEEKAIERFNK